MVAVNAGCDFESLLHIANPWPLFCLLLHPNAFTALATSFVAVAAASAASTVDRGAEISTTISCISLLLLVEPTSARIPPNHQRFVGCPSPVQRRCRNSMPACSGRLAKY